MSRILKSLNIYNMEELDISTKLSFLESIKNNSVSSDIFRYTYVIIQIRGNVVFRVVNYRKKNSVRLC